jgi:hypothetical protein
MQNSPMGQSMSKVQPVALIEHDVMELFRAAIKSTSTVSYKSYRVGAPSGKRNSKDTPPSPVGGLPTHVPS